MTDCGWMAPDGLLIINNQDLINPKDYNIITHHCMLSLENVHTKALTYVSQQTRTAQNAYWMYKFLHDSLLTDSACICITVKSAQFKVNGREDGPCYLKVLLIKFHVETNATNFHLHKSLTLLPSKMTEYKFDIAQFNDHVQAIIVKLAAGGETSSDLLIHLFCSYLTVEQDKEFNHYIQGKKEKYEEGDPEITVQNLMSLALTKYNTLVQAKVWRAKTPEEEKLITLTAQLKAAKEQIAALNKKKQSTTSNSATSNKSNTSLGNRNNHTPRKPTIPAWLPAWHKEKKGNKLEKDGKSYLWCD